VTLDEIETGMGFGVYRLTQNDLHRIRRMVTRAIEKEREACALVVEAEPELPGPMPAAYEELSREELCRGAVRATKRIIAFNIRKRGDQ